MNNAQVNCKAGNFFGKTKGGINFFYGIPYAKSITQKTQWHPPEKIKSAITLNANKPGFSSPQTIYKNSFFIDTQIPSESIDCLTLNIASKNLTAKMPVMIWIHGGAYITGSCNSVIYNLDSLPLHDIVLVTINYRLGPLGFLKLNEVTNGQIASTGNEGLMDQKLAIEWVKENISEFGGDPDNITLFGESAGAWSVALQASISPNGNLFSKAICQSGGMNAYFQIERANKWGELFLKTASDRGIGIKELNLLSHNELTKIASNIRHTMIANDQWLSPEVGFAPVADGNFLHKKPFENFKGSSIKLIVGTNADEYRLWSEFEPYYLNLTKEKFFKRLNKIFKKEIVLRIADAYMEDDYLGNKYKNALSNIMSDWTFGIHALELLEKNKNNAYGYLYNEPSPILGGRLGAYHASELPYLFGSAVKKNLREFCSINSKLLINFFQKSWTNFAKDGSPSSELFDWKLYKEKSITIINSSPSSETFKNIDRIKLLHESKKI